MKAIRSLKKLVTTFLHLKFSCGIFPRVFSHFEFTESICTENRIKLNVGTIQWLQWSFNADATTKTITHRRTNRVFLTSNSIHHIQLSLVTSVDDEKEKSGWEVKQLGRLSLENQLTSRISCVSLKNCLVYLFVSCFVINLHSRLLVSEIKK